MTEPECPSLSRQILNVLTITYDVNRFICVLYNPEDSIDNYSKICFRSDIMQMYSMSFLFMVSIVSMRFMGI